MKSKIVYMYQIRSRMNIIFLQQMNFENTTLPIQSAAGSTNDNMMPVCEDASLELRSTPAIDEEFNESMPFEDLSIFNYQNADHHLFAIAEFGELANPRVMTDFEDLFVGLDQAMEELIHQNNRSISILSMYVSNFGDEIRTLDHTRKVPTLSKTSKIRSADHECSICFNKIRKNTRVPALSCKHKFHKKCLSNWVKHKPNCPLCRHSVE